MFLKYKILTKTIDPFHNKIQFEEKDVIPCAARNLHRIIMLQLQIFIALLRAMHTSGILIHMKLRQMMFLEEFQKNCRHSERGLSTGSK